MFRTLSIGLLLCLATEYPASAEESPPVVPLEDVSFEEQDRRLFEVTVDRILREQMATWRVPGAAVTLVEEGQVLVLEGYGVADVESQRPVDPGETVFHVASVSKPVTASAVLRLVDRGLLDLDTDVNQYLDDLSVADVYPEPVTMRHLLTHTAGFDERILGREAREAEEVPTLGDYLRSRLPPRIRPPGLVSVYSDHGYALAGLAAAEIEGVSFPKYVETALFEPLDMDRSSFGPSRRTTPGLATGYGWAGYDGPPMPPDHIKTTPSSMLLTTAADMSRWMLAVLEGGSLGGQRILDPSSAAALTTRQFTNHVSIPGRSLVLSEGGRFEPPDWLHAGSTGGFTSAIVLLPHRRAGLFVAFNSRSYIWDTVNRILERYDPLDSTVEPEKFASIDVDLERFAGYYRDAGISSTTIEKLAILVDQERVSIAGERDLLWRGHPYRAVGRLAFRRVGGRARLGFMETGDEMRYLSVPGAVLERVSRLESRPVQAGVWTLFTALFLTIGVGWLGIRLPRGRTSSQLEPAIRVRSWPLRLASWAAILNLVFLVSLGVLIARAFEGDGELRYGVPDSLWLVMSLPLLSSALSLVVAAAAAGGWIRGSWSPGTRLKLSFAALAFLAFAFHLYSWNLLGYRF